VRFRQATRVACTSRRWHVQFSGVAALQMARMRTALVPVTQSSSGTPPVGIGGNAGRAARVNHGNIKVSPPHAGTGD
jgi:hypothetical protein